MWETEAAHTPSAFEGGPLVHALSSASQLPKAGVDVGAEALSCVVMLLREAERFAHDLARRLVPAALDLLGHHSMSPGVSVTVTQLAL